MPWEVIRRSRKNMTHKARRLWIDVAICADKPGGNRTHAADDARGAGVERGRGPESSTVHRLLRILCARHSTAPEVDLREPVNAKRLRDLAGMGGIVREQAHQN